MERRPSTPGSVAARKVVIVAAVTVQRFNTARATLLLYSTGQCQRAATAVGPELWQARCGQVRAFPRASPACCAFTCCPYMHTPQAHPLTSSPVICSIMVSAASSRPYCTSARPTATPRMIFSCCTGLRGGASNTAQGSLNTGDATQAGGLQHLKLAPGLGGTQRRPRRSKLDGCKLRQQEARPGPLASRLPASRVRTPAALPPSRCRCRHKAGPG